MALTVDEAFAILERLPQFVSGNLAGSLDSDIGGLPNSEPGLLNVLTGCFVWKQTREESRGLFQAPTEIETGYLNISFQRSGSGGTPEHGMILSTLMMEKFIDAMVMQSASLDRRLRLKEDTPE